MEASPGVNIGHLHLLSAKPACVGRGVAWAFTPGTYRPRAGPARQGPRPTARPATAAAAGPPSPLTLGRRHRGAAKPAKLLSLTYTRLFTREGALTPRPGWQSMNEIVEILEMGAPHQHCNSLDRAPTTAREPRRRAPSFRARSSPSRRGPSSPHGTRRRSPHGTRVPRPGRSGRLARHTRA